MKDTDGQLTFEMDDAGKIAGVTFHIGDEDRKYVSTKK